MTWIFQRAAFAALSVRATLAALPLVANYPRDPGVPTTKTCNGRFSSVVRAALLKRCSGANCSIWIPSIWC